MVRVNPVQESDMNSLLDHTWDSKLWLNPLNCPGKNLNIKNINMIKYLVWKVELYMQTEIYLY